MSFTFDLLFSVKSFTLISWLFWLLFIPSAEYIGLCGDFIILRFRSSRIINVEKRSDVENRNDLSCSYVGALYLNTCLRLFILELGMIISSTSSEPSLSWASLLSSSLIPPCEFTLSFSFDIPEASSVSSTDSSGGSTYQSFNVYSFI